MKSNVFINGEIKMEKLFIFVDFIKYLITLNNKLQNILVTVRESQIWKRSVLIAFD